MKPRCELRYVRTGSEARGAPFPVLALPVHEAVDEGDVVEVRIEDGTVTNTGTGAALTSGRYPPRLRRIVDAGGIPPAASSGRPPRAHGVVG